MRIAIIAPSPIPFVRGGAENLWYAWLGALNADARIDADLIKVPTREDSFWAIVDSYARFAALDLDHFDRVISTKYPAWMVTHRDHHVYVQHKLRGLYDTWPSALSTEIPGVESGALDTLLAVLDAARGSRAALPDIFAALEALRAEASSLPVQLFSLPGALIRRVVHCLDDIGLARRTIRRYAAISATVAARDAYFPADVDVPTEVDVLHHPTLTREQADAPPPIPEGAIFSASRLDAPKRMDWLIDAYRSAAVTTPLCIAGDGPQRAALEAMARGVPGVTLLGRLSEAQLACAYATAGFVAYVPDREDYGLITLESLQAGTPVLTTTDSGGVTELVRDGENGVVTAPTRRALARGMRVLAGDAELRERLAARAQQSVAHITWDALNAAFTRPWPRIAVVNTFALLPALSGGQLRMFHLYRELARRADVTCVNLVSADVAPVTRILAPGLTETLVPMSRQHATYTRSLARRLGASSDDIAALLRSELTPAWIEAVGRAGADADLVILSHPYGWGAVRAAGVERPTVYEAHNVESDLKAAIIGSEAPELAAVKALEGECARNAARVLCCSEENAVRMRALYGLETSPAVVPNGVDAAAYPHREAAARAAARERLGLAEHSSVALFVGSLHGPNIDAAGHIMEMARARPGVLFCLLGSVCEAPFLNAAREARKLPDNLQLTGRVSAAQLRVWLTVADAGLNPVTSGSGTNLKLLEYAVAGLPILSTPFGGRGGLLEPGTHFLAAEIDAFPAALDTLLSSPADAERRAAAARERAGTEGDWRRIAQCMWAELKPLLCV